MRTTFRFHDFPIHAYPASTMAHLIIAIDGPAASGKGTLARRLAGSGFTEVINYSFIAEKHADMLALGAEDPRRSVVRLLNPISEDQGVMRTMLLPGLLENLRRNLNFQQTSAKLFEIGKV